MSYLSYALVTATPNEGSQRLSWNVKEVFPDDEAARAYCYYAEKVNRYHAMLVPVIMESMPHFKDALARGVPPVTAGRLATEVYRNQ